MTDQSIPMLQPRTIGAVNWLGLQVLVGKECKRFLKVYAQTIVAPFVNTLLFYIVFAFALGGSQRMIDDMPYLTFLAPGLVMMSIAQNAFANTSSSLVISKIQGNIVDVLMPPLSSFELTLGFSLGGILRGLVVGIASIAGLACFTHIAFPHPLAIVYFALMGSTMMALMGLVGGLWAEKFDQLAAIQNFIVMPATFLSGTFYTADRLPEAWRFLAHLNPFFYMIDGFRYGFIDRSDGTLMTGMIYLAVVNLLLIGFSYRLIATGYKLKA